MPARTSPRCRRARARTATRSSSTARRPGSRTAASPTSTACSRARRDAPRRDGASARSSSTRTRPGLTIAERIDVIAPHPLATLRIRGLPRPGGAAARRAGRGFQGGDADARHLPRLGRGGGARLRAPRARRGDRARHLAQDVRPDARRLPAHAGGDRRHGDRDRHRRPAHLPRGLAARRRRRCARRARRRWRRWSRPKPRRRSSTARCRSSAASAWCRGQAVEKLYREIRALRIYEGATEVQKLIIARETLKG